MLRLGLQLLHYQAICRHRFFGKTKIYLYLPVSIIISLFIYCNNSLAKPLKHYSTITIYGTVGEPYDLVSLFREGGDNTPLRTVHIDPNSRKYCIRISVPDDMGWDGNKWFVDMRFWKDNNHSGIVDRTKDPFSGCHFICYNPKTKDITFEDYSYNKVYKINSSSYEYSTLINKITLKYTYTYINRGDAPQTYFRLPSESSAVAGNIRPNHEVHVRGVTRDGWVVVGDEIQDHGCLYDPKFVQLSLMEFEVEPASGVINGPVNIFSHPSTEAQILTTLDKGYEMNIVGHVKGQSWYQVAPFTNDPTKKGYAQMEQPNNSHSTPQENNGLGFLKKLFQ